MDGEGGYGANRGQGSGEDGEHHPLQIEIDRLAEMFAKSFPEELKEGSAVDNAIWYIWRLREERDSAPPLEGDNFSYLRDQFAAAALTGFLSNIPEVIQRTNSGDGTRKEIARGSYLMADAMIAAR